VAFKLAIIDLKGEILVQSKWQRSCTDFHRKNELSCQRCIASDIDLANRLEEGEKFSSYKCKNGLIDCASPIIIDGEHLANFFIGQFLIEEPDMEFFRKQAEFFNYDVEDYLNSIKDIPVIKESMLPNILGFLTSITDVITSISIEKLKAQEAKKQIEQYKNDLEKLVQQRTQELINKKEFIETLIDSQEQFIITTDGTKMITANRAFLDFYGIDNIEQFRVKYHSDCVCKTFNPKAPSEYIQITINNQNWLDYILQNNHKDKTYKAMVTLDQENYIFSINATALPTNQHLKLVVFTNITDMENAKQELEMMNKHIKESIEYSAIIQSSLIPKDMFFKEAFSDYFTFWRPKDTVGGDIYLFEKLH
jgi:ligand-binding sensor protein